MLTERDLILRLVRQLAEVLAAALRLRREGRRDEALRQIDAITGRLTGMGMPERSACSARRRWPGFRASSRCRWHACCGPVRRLLRDARRESDARHALRAAGLLVRGARAPR